MTFIGWTTKTYDSRCLDLAEVFISDNPSIDNNRAATVPLESPFKTTRHTGPSNPRRDYNEYRQSVEALRPGKSD